MSDENDENDEDSDEWEEEERTGGTLSFVTTYFSGVVSGRQFSQKTSVTPSKNKYATQVLAH